MAADSSTDASQADARRAQIYVEAARIFQTKGYHATSIHEIAEAVHLTKAGLYYYIKGKQDLLFQIMNFAMDMLEERVVKESEAGETAVDRLRLLISAHAALVAGGNGSLTILVNELEGLTDDHREQIVARQRNYVDHVRRSVVAVQQEGKLTGTDPTVAAFGLLGMVLWISRWYRPGGRLSTSEVVEQITGLATAAMGLPPEES